MLTKFKQVQELLELSPTQLADEIGVARPVISHILAGRNRPSLEVVQKLLAAFPQLNPDWLLLDTGPVLRTAGGGQTALPFPAVPGGGETQAGILKQAAKKEEPAVKSIERIVLFYSDQTFSEFRPQ